MLSGNLEILLSTCILLAHRVRHRAAWCEGQVWEQERDRQHKAESARKGHQWQQREETWILPGAWTSLPLVTLGHITCPEASPCCVPAGSQPSSTGCTGTWASLTLLCKEQDHWRQILKSSKGAGKEDTDLRASAIKGGFEIEGTMTQREETWYRWSCGSEPKLLQPVVIFHPLRMCRHDTATVFLHWVVQRKAFRLGTKTKTGEPLTFYFSTVERGKSLFIPLQVLLFYSSPLQREERNSWKSSCLLRRARSMPRVELWT